MDDTKKTKAQLIAELEELRKLKIDNQQSTLSKSALESLPYPFYVINFDDYSIVMSNSAVHQGSFEGLTCYELTHKKNKPCKSPEHICPLEEVKKTKKPCIVEHIHYDKDGNPQYLEIHGYPLFDKHGDVVQMIEYALDITERKKAEEQLLTYQERLHLLASEMLKIEGRERRRLASYLHDKISQMLVVIRVKCGILKEYFNKKETDGLIDEINTLLDQTIKDTRSLTFELSPPILNELGFAPAIEWIGEKISKDNDIRIKFNNDKQPKPMDDDMGTFLFRAVQELLTNIVKHSQAQNAKIGIRKKGGFVHIVVEDDGIGFDILEMESFNWRFSKFGLFSIQKQMERIGGNIKIKSESGQGTSITMVAPLKNADTSAKDSKT